MYKKKLFYFYKNVNFSTNVAAYNLHFKNYLNSVFILRITKYYVGILSKKKFFFVFYIPTTKFIDILYITDDGKIIIIICNYIIIIIYIIYMCIRILEHTFNVTYYIRDFFFSYLI